jgi:type III secretion protein L
MQDFISQPPVVTVLKPDSLALPPNTQVVKAADYGLLEAAQSAKLAAEQQAARIVQSAEQVRDEARLEGLQAGREAAKQEVLQVAAQLNDTMQAWIAQVEPHLIELITKCVKEVVTTTDRSAMIKESVDRGLSELANANEIKVKVNANQIETVRPILSELGEKHGLRATVRLEADPMLKEGDCIVESPMGVVDLRIDSQLQLINHTLQP